MILSLEKVNVAYEIEQAVTDVRKTMDKFSQYYATFDMKKITELWALREDDLYAAPWGCYDGIEGVRRCFLADYGDRSDPAAAERQKGCVMIRTVDSELIFVAEDIQTAQIACRVWGTDIFGENVWDEFYKNKSCNVSMNMAADLIREDGVWKIWHMREWTNWHHPHDIPATKVGRYPGFVLKEKTSEDTPPIAPGRFYERGYSEPPYPQGLPMLRPYKTFDDIAPGLGR